MSLFLGKIHYWLYNKILWFEGIEDEIVNNAKSKYKDMDDLVSSINNRFGKSTGRQPLEEVIDNSNIHGWLQQKIESAELRQAALVTELLKREPSNKAEFLRIYREQGEAAAREYRSSADTPQEIFNALNDFILEGMPCDRVNEIVSSNDVEFVWQTTMCLHRPHWNQVEGDVQNFYDLREAWVKGFVETINSEYKYKKSEGGINKIFSTAL
ncbi:MAG TPA: hypothetical protein VIO64_21095 [Pseudobacteroides sp.]|uniref:hypothetical protein n=1 Tax=Pseudobacteroides sp. TaxID=1968840 RepID=UPI002F91F3E2